MRKVQPVRATQTLGGACSVYPKSLAVTLGQGRDEGAEVGSRQRAVGDDG